MNFFEHQAKARSHSKRLVVLFALAVIVIVAAIDSVVVVAVEMSADERTRDLSAGMFARHQGSAAASSLVVVGIILIATLYKIAKLRSGGGAVARQLGGTLVASDTRNPAHRRLRNVVEEIAIASGVPVPEIYVLEQEASINAFAAGFSPADAAVTVTRGALERLSRDELQGVIAHEFSHVLNGDMRLNIKLMGVLFGILVIGIVAREFLLRSRGGSNKNAGAILLVALAVMLIGYIGLFFGRLIKAGVSRQREYLADSSAVQFTRQADGIAGALKKIGALPQGSKLTASDGEEVSHMLFGDGVGYSALFATHPPLIERIKRLQPRFDPRELVELGKRMAPIPAAVAAGADDGVEADEEEMPLAAMAAAASAAPRARRAAAPDASLSAMAAAAMAGRVRSAAVVEQVGNPSANDYEAAGRLLASIPDKLRTLAYMQDYAPALLLSLALDGDEGVRAKQLDAFATQLGADARSRVEALYPDVAALHPLQRLPLAAMAFPLLRRVPRPRLQLAVQALDAAIHADGRVHLGEYCLAKLLSLQVIDALDPSRAKVVGRAKLVDCRTELAALFGVLARDGHGDEGEARSAYIAGIGAVLQRDAPPYAPPADWSVELDKAFAALDRLDPAGKQLVVEGLVKTISHDGEVSVAEAELLRTVCAALHCPLPPILGS